MQTIGAGDHTSSRFDPSVTAPMHPTMPYPAPSAELLARIDERETGLISDTSIQARLDGLNERLESLRADELRLWRAASSASSSRQRVLWLRRALEPVLSAVADSSACRSGCSHCCHIAVQVTEREARVIAREVGRPLLDPSDGQSLRMRWSSRDVQDIPADEFARELDRIRAYQEDEARQHKGQPCPFLEVDPTSGPGAGVCRVYEVRPLACRQLVNLDRDGLLCHLVTDRDVQVPYLNVKVHAVVQMDLLGVGQRVADIRSWFVPATTMESLSSSEQALACPE